MGEDPRLPDLVKRAEAMQPQIACEIRFKARLNQFLGLRNLDWVTWGTDVLSNVSQAADAQANLTVMVQQANVPHWCDQTTAAFNAPPAPTDLMGQIGGFISRQPKYQTPQFYETKLDVGKRLLGDALRTCLEAEDKLKEKIHTLAIDSLVLQVFKETITDTGDLSMIDNKHRTFINAQQTALMQLQAFENFETTINKQIATVDQLLYNVIPQWKLSAAQQRP